jgi:hypothetical protein
MDTIRELGYTLRIEVRMKNVRTVLLAMLFAALILAQQALTNDSILKLVKAGMGNDLIINMVNTQPSNFSLGPEDLIALKKGGVSEKIISAMVMKNSNPAPAPAPAVPAVAASAGPVNEIGVYYRKAGVWTDIDPEVVSFKSGGVLKSLATDGIVKGDMNGHLKGAHSKTDVTSPVEILIYAPEGIAATEYQLLLLRPSGDAREFRTVTGGVFHKSGGASRDAIEFQAKKIAPRTFAITLDHPKGGEYGLLPPSSGDATGSTGRLGKLYTFHIIE